jgi:hypothetical protein
MANAMAIGIANGMASAMASAWRFNGKWGGILRTKNLELRTKSSTCITRDRDLLKIWLAASEYGVIPCQ